MSKTYFGVFMLLAVGTIFAFDYGPVLGSGATWLEGGELHGHHIRAGFSGGVTTRFDLGYGLRLRQELIYIQKGARNFKKWSYVYETNYEGTDGEWTNTRTYSKGFRQEYLSLPIVLEIDTYKGFFTGLGVFGDINVSPSWMNNTMEDGPKYRTIFEQDWAAFEWGALIEVGYRIDQILFMKDFDLSLRYQHNFSRNNMKEKYPSWVDNGYDHSYPHTQYIYTAHEHEKSVNHGNIYLTIQYWL